MLRKKRKRLIILQQIKLLNLLNPPHPTRLRYLRVLQHQLLKFLPIDNMHIRVLTRLRRAPMPTSLDHQSSQPEIPHPFRLLVQFFVLVRKELDRPFLEDVEALGDLALVEEDLAGRRDKLLETHEELGNEVLIGPLQNLQRVNNVLVAMRLDILLKFIRDMLEVLLPIDHPPVLIPDVVIILPNVILELLRNIVVAHVLIHVVHLLGVDVVALVEILDEIRHRAENGRRDRLADHHRESDENLLA